MRKITFVLLAFTMLTTVIISCKKDDDKTVTATGSASADFKVGTATATAWTATAATAVKSGASYTITATNASGNLVIKLDNVTATGTYNFSSATRNAVFTSGAKTYSTLNNGGGSTTITVISSSRIEGTFFCEMFDGTAAGATYGGLTNGKFSASF
jgi:hypothetical protein